MSWLTRVLAEWWEDVTVGEVFVVGLLVIGAIGVIGMVEELKRLVPEWELVPRCPRCGEPRWWRQHHQCPDAEYHVEE